MIHTGTLASWLADKTPLSQQLHSYTMCLRIHLPVFVDIFTADTSSTSLPWLLFAVECVNHAREHVELGGLIIIHDTEKEIVD